MEPDFSGYATKAGLKCTDGRTIMEDAFKHQDKLKVPLVYAHNHKELENVLGHAYLENRTSAHPEGAGVYCYGFFNKNPKALLAKQAVEHQDLDSLSIWANELIEKAVTGGRNVFHGAIKEVSLVLSGANSGAKIDQVRIQHSDDPDDFTDLEDTAVIYSGTPLEHESMPDDFFKTAEEVAEHAEGTGETVQDVYDSMSDKQKDVLHFMVAAAVDGGAAEHSETPPEGGQSAEGDLAHQEGTGTVTITSNVFEQNGSAAQAAERPKLTKDQIKTIMHDWKQYGTLEESFMAHAVDYGIENIDLLFPDYKAVMDSPEFVSRQMEWVTTVLSGVRKQPFSRIKSLSADITHDEARAKGYVKGTLKKEEFFALAKRETGPKTIYKKQKLDRDDIIDITDLDVVAWLKAEMRVMLNEEIARAMLVGDGREVDDEDKIDETKIRPIAFDDNFYAHQVNIANNASNNDAVEAVLRARKFYKGKGNPTMFTTEDFLTDLLLTKTGLENDLRPLYPTQADLERKLRVSGIVTVEVMEGVQTSEGNLLAIFVNLADYTMGTDRGGEINFFDDFDIDYNQEKYLIETRFSGALTKYKTALILTKDTASGSVTPTVPTFVASTGVVTIPSVTGVVYKNAATGATLSSGAQSAIPSLSTIEIEAVPATGYQFPHNFDADWEFTRTT